MPRAGHADIAKTSFFLDIAVRYRGSVREQLLFQPGKEHDAELQPLGGVYGHQAHAVDISAVGVGVGEQGQAVEERTQR